MPLPSYPWVNASGKPAYKGTSPCYKCADPCSGSLDCSDYDGILRITFEMRTCDCDTQTCGSWTTYDAALNYGGTLGDPCVWGMAGTSPDFPPFSLSLTRVKTCPCTWEITVSNTNYGILKIRGLSSDGPQYPTYADKNNQADCGVGYGGNQDSWIELRNISVYVQTP